MTDDVPAAHVCGPVALSVVITPHPVGGDKIGSTKVAFSEILVRTALDELGFWTDGNLKECEPNRIGAKRVGRYWLEGLGVENLHGCKDVPWSAAFICFCLLKAGLHPLEFAFGAGHHTYIRWAVENTKRSKPAKTYYGERLNDYAPQPGDLIAQWRKKKKTDPDPNITFDHIPDQPFISHCDIVVSVSTTKKKIVTVGGNLSQRVKTSEFSAQNGILSSKKELICVLRCAKT